MSVRCVSISPSDDDDMDRDEADHSAMEEEHDEWNDPMDEASTNPHKDYFSDYSYESDSDECSGTKRPCQEDDDRDSDFQPWKRLVVAAPTIIEALADRRSENLIAFLRSFACNSDYYLANHRYDARRISLKAILREAKEKDLHYERMDAPAAVAHHPLKLCIDLTGPQRWYLDSSPYRKKTITITENVFDSGARIAISVLGHYDSCRRPLDVYLNAANRAAKYYEEMDSPVPHDPFFPVVHDHADYLADQLGFGFAKLIKTRYLKTPAIAPRSPTYNIVAAALVHYDARRVSKSRFMRHIKQAEERYLYADLSAAYADILAKQPAFDIREALDKNFYFHDRYFQWFSSSPCSISKNEFLMTMPCMIYAGLLRKQKEMIERRDVTNKKLAADLEEAQRQRDSAVNTNWSLQVEIESLKQLQQHQLPDKTTWSGAVQGAHWQFYDGGNWYSFDSDANQTLHQAYMEYCNGGSDTITVTSCGASREIQFAGFVQINPSTGTRRDIRLKLDSPPTWTTPSHKLLWQTTHTRQMYMDEADRALWKAMYQLLTTTGHASSSATSRCSVMANVRIKAIYRIEHFALWRKYMHRVRMMLEEHARLHVDASKIRHSKGTIGWVLGSAGHALDKHGALAHDINEQWLFHGTTYNNADSIVRSGFDFRKCQRGMYGAGVYFASEACKGNQYTCVRHTGVNDVCTCKCERTMIVARVALGDPFYATATLPNQRRPPEHRSGHRVYDSIIANPGPMKGHFNGYQEHQEFVIFNMEQAYPSFVVQYELS